MNLDKICSEYKNQENFINEIYKELNHLFNLNELQNFIKKHKEIDKIIIYGLRAKGTYFDESEIDILIVGTDESNKEIILETKNIIYKSILNKVPLDITLYDYHKNIVYHTTFGSDILDEKLFEHELDYNLSNPFYKTPCFHFNGTTVSYEKIFFLNNI